MKHGLSLIVPVVFFVCLFGFFGALSPDFVNAQGTRGGICCLNGQLTPNITANDCQARRGTFFTNERDAQQQCPLMARCYCCDNGVATLTTLGACRLKGNPCYKTKEEAANLCKPPCFCCVKGSVNKVTAQTCKSQGGVCYTSFNDASARCQRPK